MSNEIKGTVSSEENIRGVISVGDGDSAYEVAVKNGFNGSEPEWLASLKGEKGSSGVYVGSGEMPADCNVQIDPNGEFLTLERLAEILRKQTHRITSVTLLADAWVGTSSPYSQTVTISGVTSKSKIDLNPTIEQLSIFHTKDIAFVVGNNNGIITVYCVGQKPTNDYIMQATITEVGING